MRYTLVVCAGEGDGLRAESRREIEWPSNGVARDVFCVSDQGQGEEAVDHYDSILMKKSQTDGAPARGVMRIPAAGGSPTLAFPARPILRGFDVSSDGSHYAYSTNENVEELWALDNVLPTLK